jgi:H+/Cl- antiporter ClcA
MTALFLTASVVATLLSVKHGTPAGVVFGSICTGVWLALLIQGAVL